MLTAAEGGRVVAKALLPGEATANVAARLRGVGLGGRRIEIDVEPRLSRDLVRDARTKDARRRRDHTPGFARKGTRLDPEGRMSLTPEPIAVAMAARIAGERVVDACAGAGGNAIAFARARCDLVAIEIDSGRLALARHNARVYGVASRIRFVLGNAIEIIPTLAGDLLFLDVPWGEEWNRARTTPAELPLLQPLLDVARRCGRYRAVWAKVPPSFDPSMIPGARPEAFFGVARGDYRHVKFVVLEMML